MVRLVLFLLAVAAAAVGLHWLADTPGTLRIDWHGYVVERTMFQAVVILSLVVAFAVLAWSILRQLWRSPAAVGQMFVRRREQRGLTALSSGLIAIGSGDKAGATRAAIQARKSLPNEPLTHLLRAQTAQLSGDSATARRIFEAMLATPDTEQLGLRGLFLEAERVGEQEAARQFAERALRLNPKADWPVDALFELQCKFKDWDGALETLATAKRHGHIEKAVADRRRAVLLTAQAMILEDENSDKALNLALEAHNLAPELVPAAAIAGRVLASRGQTPKAAKVIQRTWKSAPHPELAMAYAHARTGDSISDRLERLRQLTKLTPGDPEGPLALAENAMLARDWTAARAALEPLLDSKMTQRVATLMARIEGEQHGHTGKVREWLARAINAPRDPVWTADGIVSDSWAPVSPVTGRLDAYEWRVPLAAAEQPDALMLKSRLEELVQLGAKVDARGGDAMLAAPLVPKLGDPEIFSEATASGPARKPVATAVEDAVEVTIRTGKPATQAHSAAKAVQSSPAAPASAPHDIGHKRSAQDYLMGTPEPSRNGAGAHKGISDPKGTGPGLAKRKEPGRKPAAEPKVILTQRAPDDPGPGNDEDVSVPTITTPATRSAGSKR